MKVLVTGGAGFLASHVVPALLGRGDDVVVHDVIAPDLAERINVLFKLAGQGTLKDRFSYRWKSVVDLVPEDLEGVDQVVHLAGVTDVPLSNSSPRYTFQFNVDAALALFDAVRRWSILHPIPVLALSTENVYGAVPPERLPATEDEPFRPRNNYAASKVAMEAIAYYEAYQNRVPVTILRSSTLFGPSMRPRQVVSIFTRQALAGNPITLEGDGTQTRDFNYVDNMVWAVLKAVDMQQDLTLKGFNAFNIGSGEEITLKEFIDKLLAITGSASSIQFKAWRPGEEGRLSISIGKAKRVLGYEPTISVDEGLKRYVESLQ